MQKVAVAARHAARADAPCPAPSAPLSKAMAIDLASRGIRANTVAPTFIETPMTAAFLDDDEFRQRVLAKIKLGRLGRVEDITGAVVYLASDASALMTGASMVIDGGWTAE